MGQGTAWLGISGAHYSGSVGPVRRLDTGHCQMPTASVLQSSDCFLNVVLFSC